MRRGSYQGPRRVMANPPMRRDWEEFDPRMEEYYDRANMYTSGPGQHLPSDNLPYSLRTTGLPFKLFVSGIHPHTTEEGIRHIFSNYGHPLSVFRTRNKYNQPIAFVDFETQLEANSAIAQLDGKPPLNWEVSYAAPRNDEKINQQFLEYGMESDYDRQTPLFPTHRTMGIRQTPMSYPRPMQELGNGHPTEPVRSIRDVPAEKPCGVCGHKADYLCPYCKARYCSIECQSLDWATHREVCVPPPPLMAAHTNYEEDIIRAPRMHGANVSVVPGHSGPYAHSASVRPPNNSTEMDSPHLYMIKGIHPLDQADHQHSSSAMVRNEATTMVPKAEASPSNQGCKEIKRTVCLQPNGRIEVKSSPAILRSPNWKSNGSPQNNGKSNGTPPQNSTANSHPKQNGHTNTAVGTIPKNRNYPVGNYSPKSPITSPPKRTPPPVVTKMYAKEFSKRELKPLSQKPCEVSVCFAKSPDEFYIQYTCFREMLQKMMIAVQIAAPNSDAMINPIEGMPCLAIFHQDRQWYRGKVMKVFPDGIGVRYVDFGNTAKMPNSPENFRLMEHEFSENPFFTFKAKLAEVLPVSGNCWNQEVKQKFKALTQDNFFVMELVEAGTDIITVRLKSQDNTDIASLLIKENLARKALPELEISDELDRMTPVNATPPNPVKGLPISFQKLSLLRSPATQQMSLVSPQPATLNSTLPAQLPAPTVSPTRAAFREAPAVKPRTPSLPAIISPMRCKTPSVVASPPPSQPENKSVLNALDVGRSVTFLVTLVNGCENCVGSVLRDEDMSVLESDLLSGAPEGSPSFKPTVGSIVSAFSVAHSQWFRACITKVLNSTFSVLYVDFGNTEDDIISVKPVPPSFTYLELAVNLIAENLTAEAKQHFETNLVGESIHQLEIVSKERDGSLLAKFVGGIPAYTVSLKPWTSLLVQAETKTVSQKETQPIPVSPPKREVQPIKECLPALEIKTPKWDPGFSCDVMVFVAEDVDRIYVQAVTSEVLSLSEQIQLEINSSFPTIPEMKTFPDVGTYVAALFPEDGIIYRARVTNVKEGGAIDVFYLDFGNSCTVSLADIRPLPEKMYEYPSLGQRIALARVDRPAGSLPKAVQEMLWEYVDNVFNMLIVPSTTGLTECTLTKDGRILNEVIANLLKAEQLNHTAVVKPLMTMPKLESALPTPVDNTLGEFFYENGPFLELPMEGSFQALVLSADSPQVLMLRINNDDVSAKLVQLEDELTTYAGSVSRGHSPAVSEICIALFPDGKWYRAACLEVIPDPAGTRYACVQVDHGEMHIIDVDCIRRIPKRLVNFLPYLANQTILEGTENMEEISVELSTRVAGILTKNSLITATVVSRLEGAFIVRIPEVSQIISK